MRNEKESFIQNRWRSMRYAIRGLLLLLKTESAIQVHFTLAAIFVFLGLYFQISPFAWTFQFMVFGLILSVESLNTGIEKICDFIHPDFHDRIGFIKDISAGAVTFAVLFGYIALGFIYLNRYF